MSEAEALCLPSLWEGMPITILEALSVGCPTIANPVGGIPEMVRDGYNGFLSKERSEEGYYESMIRYLNTSPSIRNKMRVYCLETFQHFDIQQTAQKYLETYQLK